MIFLKDIFRAIPLLIKILCIFLKFQQDKNNHLTGSNLNPNSVFAALKYVPTAAMLRHNIDSKIVLDEIKEVVLICQGV